MIKNLLILFSFIFVFNANAVLTINVKTYPEESMCSSYGSNHSDGDNTSCRNLNGVMNSGYNCFVYGDTYTYHYRVIPLDQSPPLGYSWVSPTGESDVSDEYAIYMEDYLSSDIQNQCGSLPPDEENSCNTEIPEKTNYISVSDSEISSNFTSYTNKLYKSCSSIESSKCETYVAVNYEYVGNYQLKQTITQQTSGSDCSSAGLDENETYDPNNVSDIPPPEQDIMQTEEENIDLHYCNDSGGSDGVSYCSEGAENFICEEGQSCGDITYNTPNSEIDPTKEVVKNVDIQIIENEDGSKTEIKKTTTQQVAADGTVHKVIETNTTHYNNTGDIINEGTSYESTKESSHLADISKALQEFKDMTQFNPLIPSPESIQISKNKFGELMAGSKDRVENFEMPIHEEKTANDFINEERLVSGKCPAPISLQLLGSTVLVPIDKLCSFFELIGHFVLIMCTFVATRIYLT